MPVASYIDPRNGQTYPPDVPRWGVEYKRYLARYFTRHMSIGAWLETLPNRHSYLDLDPIVKDQLGRPVARITAKRQPNPSLSGRL